MGVGHGRLDVAVTQEILNRPDVVAGIEQVGREGVPQGVGGGGLDEPGPPNGLSRGLLHDCLVEMVPVLSARLPVGVKRRGREHVLPPPVSVRVGAFLGQGEGQRRPAESAVEILLMKPARPFEVTDEVLVAGRRQYRDPAFRSFSVPDGVKPPPSLVNIFKELCQDLEIPYPKNGNLEPWSDRGVLLLNATLSVRANSPGSHQNKGWEQFTDHVIRKLSEEREGIVFMLWGNFAKRKAELINASKHHILTAAHPSPLAGGAFFGCAHFSKANALLKARGIEPIDWSL